LSAFGFFGWSPVRTAAFAVAAAFILAPVPALADPSFPGAIQDWLVKKNGTAPDCPVPCLLCHTTAVGTADSVIQAETGFLSNLETRDTPLDPGAPAGVGFALDRLATKGCRDADPAAPFTPCDSDGDKVPDIEELRLGRDPDGSRNFDTCVKYGCGATVAPQRSAHTKLAPLWLLAAVGVVAVARRRPRRS
jgi:MYXO-CTERM domain-containing protein